MKAKIARVIAAASMAAWLSLAVAEASKLQVPAEQGRPVDLVIALDVSGSMEGLIESAKQRLWDVVNELGQAQPAPDLRLAIVTYGNPGYGAQTGFVKVDQAFTRDLDAVMQTLFSFRTNGGDEYVARAIHTSVRQLDWSQSADALKIIFVAGNEAADQDPAVSVIEATQAAAGRQIVVNTLYCGNEGDSIVAGWQRVSQLTNGLFASIDQNVAAVANIATPMDQQLAQLNAELNQTYVAYGEQGERYKANQSAQDRNAESMSLPSVASRAVAKAGRLYRNESWDLVDAVDSGVAVEELDEDALPEEMRPMTTAERREYVDSLATRRQEIRAQIATLGVQRQDYIQDERNRQAAKGEAGLDEAMLEGIRLLARDKGFEIE